MNDEIKTYFLRIINIAHYVSENPDYFKKDTFSARYDHTEYKRMCRIIIGYHNDFGNVLPATVKHGECEYLIDEDKESAGRLNVVKLGIKASA